MRNEGGARGEGEQRGGKEEYTLKATKTNQIYCIHEIVRKEFWSGS